ncbi:QsdR family transcriptional regulator [Ketobacter sp.]|uniref:QsdR family transcriptional regulator n=1 Tax=Ketobacter sp. TaxID=2083498 RepID=UPI0025BD150F|nr:QsdR family transcriptional regulator [Ketobacter sp.]
MSESKRKTPLSKALSDKSLRSRATPLDAFNLAKKHWLLTQKLNVGELAEELGVSRATLFRWIGNKDLLMGEIMWSLYKPTVLNARKVCSGEGVEYVVNVFREVNTQILNSQPMRTWLHSDGQYAVSILSSKSSHFHSRMVELNSELLKQETAKGLIHPAMTIDSLSYFMCRIGNSCIFSEMILGQEPDLNQLEEACTAVRILLGGR